MQVVYVTTFKKYIHENPVRSALKLIYFKLKERKKVNGKRDILTAVVFRGIWEHYAAKVGRGAQSSVSAPRIN